MHSEYNFLFNPSLNLNTDINNDNQSNIYGRRVLFSGSTADSVGEGIFVYKRPDVYGTQNIKNYIIETSYRDGDSDPYIELIRYFSTAKMKAMRLRAADFAYLKDIGVYPINRLWVLRRYPENVIVPDRPTDNGENAVEPISTVVGWIKDSDSNPMLSVKAGETWIEQNQMIDKVINKLMKDEFKMPTDVLMSVPGWGQGILFGMLNAMKGEDGKSALSSSFSSENIPTGDPNVLRASPMRQTESQSLTSSLNVTLETCYEQKYINGVDPGSAFLDIISNLLKMGTSDQKFVLNANSQFIKEFMNNVNNPGNVQAWINLTIKLIKSFIDGITEFFNTMKDIGGESGNGGTGGGDDPLGAITGSSNALLSSGAGVVRTILIGTISKYRWELKSSIALMTGLNITPWHLTVGNPYSPIINIANIIVENVDMKFSNDLGFNDLPVRIDVKIDIRFGRPLGKQEIEKMFNNGYRRIYSKSQIGS